MENRFGIKDLFLFLLVCGLIVLVLLQMKQYDRQWDDVKQVLSQVNDQTKDLARIESMLQQGVVSTGMPTTTHAAPPDVDKRVRRIHSAPDFATGDDVVDVLSAPPDKLTALINTDLYSQQIQGYVLDSLVDRDPVTLAWEPRVATDWKISPDGLTIDFNMRRGVTFSNGDPLTADDVVYSVQMIQNEKIEAPGLRTYYEKLKSCEKTGDYSVRFVFKEPYFMAFEVAGSFTVILSKKFYSRYTPQQINESTGLLLGSGPYRLPDPTSWKPEPGKPVVLVRNERYWGEPGGPDRLVWRIIDLPAARMTALRNGEIDMFYQPAADQFDAAKADPQLSATHNTIAMPTVDSGYQYVGWNEKRHGNPTYFADRRVRQAMTMLIDRQRIIREIQRGYATIATGPFNPMSPQSDPTIKPLPFDPEQAQKLLADAGFKRQNNALFGPDGKQFSFDLMYPASSSTGKRMATFIVDSMAQAGIIARPAATEWTVLLQRLKERDVDAVIIGWGGAVEDDPQQIFSSSAIKGVGDNFVQYSNPKLDDAIDRARRTVDDSQRTKIWHEVHRILHEDQPYTFLFVDEELDIVDKRFKGVEPTKFGIIRQKNEWYVPRAMQKYHD